jgi:FKBP-type peptidyl-prolyl cis-trans isomerase 2
LNITARTQKGKIFRVSSEEDAKKAGIYDEKKANQGFYTPEFVIVGKPGFLNEGLTEVVKGMKFFEKKSVRIPPTKAFGKRDPQKIERIGIAKFRRLNKGKNPEIGQEFTKQSQGQVQRGTVTNVVQGRVIVDYNHPLAGQNIDYNLEIIDKIEDFNEKIEYFMINKGIPQENIKDFQISYIPKSKTVEITIPKMFLFQNLTYVKFGLAMDLQSHMSDEIDDVKFIEVFEKIPLPQTPSESVMEKVEEFNKEQEDKEVNQK